MIGPPSGSTTQNLSPQSFDITQIRRDFPALSQMVNGKPLVYLDNAATTQKSTTVIEALSRYYSKDNANVHRGVHALSERATTAYEGAREKTREFLNASKSQEIIFVRGATEGINLVAQVMGQRLQPGDEIVISTMEHHSNIVPWQMLRDTRGVVLRVIPINDAGELILNEYNKLLNERTRLVSLVHLSNVIGTINPIREVIVRAHNRGVPVLIDGAQAVSHVKVDVQALDCDFYVFSSHKLFGPTGVGVLYGKESLLESLPPYQGGGEMISSVSFDRTVYNKLPYKFEAGTPNIAGVIGLGTAIDYVTKLGLEKIAAHKDNLMSYATESVGAIEGVRIIGTAEAKASVLSFIMDNVHPHDVGTILDQEGIAVRTGHHCGQPLMDRFGLVATVRASFAFYNTSEEVDKLVSALHRVREVFV